MGDPPNRGGPGPSSPNWPLPDARFRRSRRLTSLRGKHEPGGKNCFRRTQGRTGASQGLLGIFGSLHPPAHAPVLAILDVAPWGFPESWHIIERSFESRMPVCLATRSMTWNVGTRDRESTRLPPPFPIMPRRTGLDHRPPTVRTGLALPMGSGFVFLESRSNLNRSRREERCLPQIIK